jgi:hypothetical protein
MVATTTPCHEIVKGELKARPPILPSRGGYYSLVDKYGDKH